MVALHLGFDYSRKMVRGRGFEPLNPCGTRSLNILHAPELRAFSLSRALDLASPSLSLALEGYALLPTPAKTRFLPRTRFLVGDGAHIKLMQKQVTSSHG